MKTCLNCARYGFAWWDKGHKFPFCYGGEDWAFDIYEEDILIDRDITEPGDCEWIPIGSPLPTREKDPEPIKPIKPVLSLRERLTLKRQGKLR